MILREEIIKRACEVHGDKFDYTLVDDSQNMLSKIKIICKKHGVFEQTIHNHLQGKGCKLCYVERGRKTNATREQVIEYASKTHADIENYDFSVLPEKLNLNNYSNSIKLKCKKHGEFKISLKKFLNGEKCPYCEGKRLSYADILNKLIILHPELDFSITNISQHDEKYRIFVKCPKHGVQKVKYYNLLYGQGGCNECGYEKISKNQTLTTEEFLKKTNKIHGDKFIYDNVEYVNAHTKVEIICPKHGAFFVTPTNFLDKKSGCPSCNSSHLESDLSDFLKNNNIKFKQEMQFKWLGLQKLDFYLPDYNVAIECQGIQHFIPSSFSNNKDKEFMNNNLKEIIENDVKKYNRCLDNLQLLYLIPENNFKKEYFKDDKYCGIYTKDNVFFNKEKLFEKIRGSK